MLHYHVLSIVFILTLSNIYAVKLDLKDFMVAGAIATAATDFMLYPIDTVKVTQQSDKKQKSFTQTANRIYRNGNKSINRFFNGAFGYAALDGFSAAIFFAVYEEMKLLSARQLTGAALGLSAYPSAAVAFVASTIFLVPAEFVKTRMQTSSYYNSSFDCVRESTQSSAGWRGLYTGYSAIWIRDLPYFSLQLGCYDNIKNLLSTAVAFSIASRAGLTLNPNNVELMSSIAAGFITAFLTNPMDVVTTRLITQNDQNSDSNKRKKRKAAERAVSRAATASTSTKAKGSKDATTIHSSKDKESHSSHDDRPYTGLVDCVTRMYKEEGVQAFFAGAVARVAWITPFTAISLGLNERLKRHLLQTKLLAASAEGAKIGLGGGIGKGFGAGGSAMALNMFRKFRPPPRGPRKL